MLTYTPWGFRLRVVGGNPEAARRAGLGVGGLSASAPWPSAARWPASAGCIELAGAEFKLRPGLLARLRLHRLPRQWLGRHHPLKVIGSAARSSAAIAVGGNSLRSARPAGGSRQHAHGAGAARRLRLEPSQGGPVRDARTVLTGAVRGGTSILYAALGETVAERSGVINLGTEGSMLCGALAAYAVGIETGNPWVGVLAGLLAGALLAAVHAFLVLRAGARTSSPPAWW